MVIVLLRYWGSYYCTTCLVGLKKTTISTSTVRIRFEVLTSDIRSRQEECNSTATLRQTALWVSE